MLPILDEPFRILSFSEISPAALRQVNLTISAIRDIGRKGCLLIEFKCEVVAAARLGNSLLGDIAGLTTREFGLLELWQLLRSNRLIQGRSMIKIKPPFDKIKQVGSSGDRNVPIMVGATGV